jgi:molybdopterin converting factor subunit 1
MQVKVLFLGPARDMAGVESSEMNLPHDCTAGRLKHGLSDRFPPLARAMASMRMAVNCVFVTDEHRLRDGDEVAVIPPVSGG